ncbi:MAG TPA: hypothetical protein VJ672_12925 [Gemmatimonadaceae bacterium]|nr:hypothetical protein [Gemmatimonadaceae bacterium]
MRTSTISFVVALLVIGAAQVPPIAELHAQAPSTSRGVRGDSAALTAVQLMLNHLGGRELWAKARSLHVRERAYSAALKQEMQAEFWRDVREPRIWYRQVSPETERTVAITGEHGWQLRDGKLTEHSAAEIQRWTTLWPRLLYTMFYRLAAGDSTITVRLEEPRTLLVLDGAGVELCRFFLNAAGEMIRWRVDDREDHLYGPLRSFGQVRMPDWGASTDARYRFYYTAFEISPDPPPISFARPSSSGTARSPR